jgi:hypothetical protein
VDDENRGLQRVARHIFSSRGIPANPQVTLYPGEFRRTAIRCQLPRLLPPTFCGTAVRFSYSISISYRAEFSTVAGSPFLSMASGSPAASAALLPGSLTPEAAWPEGGQEQAAADGAASAARAAAPGALDPDRAQGVATAYVAAAALAAVAPASTTCPDDKAKVRCCQRVQRCKPRTGHVL